MSNDQMRFPEDPTAEYWKEIDRRRNEREAAEAAALAAETKAARPPAALELFQFEQTNIRTVTIGGVRWAVSADICTALGIKNASDSLKRIDDEDKLIIRRSDTLDSNEGIWDAFASGVQSVGLVSEDGATELVLESRKPEARRFRKWLTHTVWPSIRDTGSYSISPELKGPELLARAVIEAQAMLAAKDQIIESQEQKILTDAPKVEFYDEFMDADGLYSVGSVAKMLGWGEVKLFRELRRRGVLIGGKDAMYNTPYQRYMHHFDVAPSIRKLKNGEVVTDRTTRVRPTGIAFISKKLGQPILRQVSDED